MQIYVAAILILISPLCKTKPDFTLLKAEYRNFAGGTVWSSSGTTYHIEVEVLKNIKNIEINAVWVGKRKFDKLTVVVDNQDIEFNNLSKGQKLRITFTHTVNNNHNISDEEFEEMSDGKYADCQIEFSGKGLILYTVNGKEKYFEIEKMDRLDPLLRP